MCLTHDTLPTERRNVITIKNNYSVKIDVPGLKPSNVLKKEKNPEKSIRKVPGSDKDTKAPTNKARSKKLSGKKNMIQIFLHPQVVKHLPIKQTIRKIFCIRTKK